VSYFFHPDARVEHLEHVAFYESRQSGLGGRYLSAFESAMAQICKTPYRFAVEHPPEIRRRRIAGFPYNVLYRSVRGEIEILAIAAHKRRPSYWVKRL
jgi:plasmid stabilization system protein ParE